MRVFVSFEETVHNLDVDIRETVGYIKNTFRERFGLNLKNHRNETVSFVSLLYEGSSLQDSWVYSDLGIPPGSTLVCRVEKQVEPTLTVHCINYDEKKVYKHSFDVWETSVATLRGMIQDSTGIPVSAFRLYSKSGLELFDCHPLKVYGIDAGDMVTMEIWRDVADVVQAARDNEITDTLGSLASFQDGPHLLRYQLQLGLFTSAHFGYHQLATQLMKCGAKPDEPVGQHPSRDWCRASAHVDHMKTPAHEAAQHGRLKCLQYFLMFNYAVLICKDAHGLTPSNIARRYKQTECFKLLVAEQFRIPSVHPELSVHVYSRVRKWCDRARMRTRLHKDKTAMLLLTNAEVAQKRAVVGQRVEVDGYSGLGKGDRKVKSAPSSLNTSSDKSHSATSRGNIEVNSWSNPVSRGNAQSNPLSNPSTDAFSLVRRTKSDITSQVNSKTNQSNNALSSNLHEKSYSEISRRQDSNLGHSNRKQNSQSASVTCSITSLKDKASRPIHKSNNSTPGYKTPLNSSFATPRVSRAGHTKSRDSMCREHVLSRSAKTHREQTLAELGKSGKGENWRYIWKSLDDVITENQENRRISMDKIEQARTSAINDQRDPVQSNDTPNTGEISAKSREINGSTVDSNNTGEKPILQDDRPVLSRDKIGDGRQKVTSNINRQSLASFTREAYNARKGATPSKSGSTLEDSHQANSPVKRRSALSRELLYHGSVESNADKCLRVACETFRKKTWLGQLQMALVVNTNMCKRR